MSYRNRSTKIVVTLCIIALLMATSLACTESEDAASRNADKRGTVESLLEYVDAQSHGSNDSATVTGPKGGIFCAIDSTLAGCK